MNNTKIRYIEVTLIKRIRDGRIYNCDTATLRTTKQGNAHKLAQEFYGRFGWTVETVR